MALSPTTRNILQQFNIPQPELGIGENILRLFMEGQAPIGGDVPPVNDLEVSPLDLFNEVCGFVHDFCMQRWQELRICCKALYTMPSISDCVMQRHVDALSAFSRQMDRCAHDDRGQKEELLATFERLNERTRECFVDLSPDVLQQFVNETNPRNARKMLESFSSECRVIATVQKVLLPVRAFFAQFNSSPTCDSNTDLELSSNSTNPFALRVPRVILKTQEKDLLSLNEIGRVQEQRGQAIQAMKTLIGDQYRPQGENRSLFDILAADCPIKQEGPMGIPVFHNEIMEHHFERAGILGWLDTGKTNCPTCRATITRAMLRMNVQYQQRLARELANELLDMPEETLIARLHELVDEDLATEISAEGQQIALSKAQAKEKLVDLINELPDDVQGRNLFQYLAGLYMRHIDPK